MASANIPSSAFDFLLGDLTAAPVPQRQQQQQQQSASSSASATAPAAPQQQQQATAVKTNDPLSGLDWLTNDVAAPHPDAFELELESLIGSGGLDSAELAALTTTTVDAFNPVDLGLFSQYRSPHTTTYSAYSGYGPSVITASSETLSAYGSTYEPYEKLTDTTAAGSGAQHLPSSLSSLFPDIDLDLAAFNLAAATGLQSVDQRTMLPRLSLDIDSTNNNSGDNGQPRSRGTSSAYDSASPPSAEVAAAAAAAAASYYNAAGSAAYRGAGATHPSLTGLGANPISATERGKVPVPKVESSSAAASVSERDDPRKKYQCPSCPRAFARAFNLKTHMATHDPNRVKSFVCRHSGCGRSFSRKHDLGRHLVSIHQDNSGVGPSASSSSTSPTTASASAGPSKSRPSPPGSSIGVGGEKQRVWCDNCGRGWLAGSRDACDCASSVKEEQ